MKELTLLVTRARNGDLDAYGRIVRRFQDMAYGFGFSILGDFHLAQDAAQEAFIEAYRQLGQLEKPAAFPGWFRKIVFKHCDRILRNKNVPTTTLDAAAGVAANITQPVAVAEKHEMKEKVLEAIKALPEHQRTATTLFYINGYSQKEVAEFLDVPVTTVKKRLHDSRKQLKERMIDMVEETLKDNAPDERFSQKIIDELLGRPRLLEIEGHPIKLCADAIHKVMGDYEWIVGDEVVHKSFSAGVESGLGKIFSVDTKTALRSETSITTFQAMVGRTPPVHLITAGRVFRDDAEDAIHQKVFHQLDAVCIEAGVDKSAMKAMVVKVIEAVLSGVDIRQKPAKYPCVESALDISVKNGQSWLEIAGCGMLTAETLERAGYDPQAVSGFAFGVGIERLAMLKYGIDDIRKLWQPPYVPDKAIK